MTTQINNSIKYCIDCNCELIIGTNWIESRKKCYSYICNKCSYKRTSAWTQDNPEQYKELKRDWYDNNPDYYDNYRINNAKKCRLIVSNWRKNNPEKNRLSHIKDYTRRKRDLEWIELFENPFPDNIPVVAHHISDAFVVYIPVELHLKHLHGQYKQLHRDELQPYIEFIYNITYIIE